MPSTLLSTSTPTYIRIVYLQSWAVLSIAQLARPHSPPGTTGGFKGLKLEAALRGTSGTAEEGADNCCISIGVSVAPEAQSFWGRSGSERTALLIAHHPSQLLGQFVSSQLVRAPLKKELLSSATSIYRPVLKITWKKTTHICTFLFCVLNILEAEAAR